MTSASSSAKLASRPSRRVALGVATGVGTLVALGFSAPWIVGAIAGVGGGPVSGPLLAPTILEDEDGRPVAFPAPRRPTAAAFIYSSCPDVCPLAYAVLAAAAEGSSAAHLAVSVDPQGDTQSRRKAYVQAHGGGVPFLGGGASALEPIWSALQLGVRAAAPPRVEHREVFVVFDRDARASWIGPFRGTSAEALRAAVAKVAA